MLKLSCHSPTDGRHDLPPEAAPLLAAFAVEFTRPTAVQLPTLRCEKTVTHAAPCLLGLYAVVALLYDATLAGERSGRLEWPGKATATFSDALACVRRRMWSRSVLPQVGRGAGLTEFPEPVRELLLTTPAPAA